jgi:hypothetical protein
MIVTSPIRVSAQNKERGVVRAARGERGLVVRVGAPTSLRVRAIRDKLSSPGRVVTDADACRTLVLVGLASVGDATAEPRWPLRELRRLSGERPGTTATNVSMGFDTPAKRRVEGFRKRLSTPRRRCATAAALRTLVLMGLDYAETLAAEDLGQRLWRFVKSVAPTLTSRSKTSAAPRAARHAGRGPGRSGRS